MVNEQILAYVRDQLRQGVPRETVIRSLLNAGWKTEDVNEALNVAAPLSGQQHTVAVPTPEPTTQNTSSTAGVYIHQTPEQQPKPEPTHKSREMIFALSLIAVIVLLGAGALFVYFRSTGQEIVIDFVHLLLSQEKDAPINDERRGGHLPVPETTYEFGDSKMRARDAKRISDAKQIQLAMELFFDKQQSYPNLSAGGTTTQLISTHVLYGNLTDPFSNEAYPIIASSTGFVIGVQLEEDNHSSLYSDVDGQLHAVSATPGIIYSINCDDPVYCVTE